MSGAAPMSDSLRYRQFGGASLFAYRFHRLAQTAALSTFADFIRNGLE